MGKASLFERLGFVAGQPMPIELFREQVIEFLLLERPDAKLERINRDEIEARWDGDSSKTFSFSVAEAYAAYLRRPNELVHVIGGVGMHILNMSVAPSLNGLVVLIQGEGYNPNPDTAPPHLERPIVNGLLAVVVVDNPYGLQFLTAKTLGDALGIDEATIWDRAMENTVARLEITEVSLDPKQPTTLLRNDGLATSLLLVDSFWDAPRQSEALVAAPVAPNKLLVAPERNARAVKALRHAMLRDPLDPQWRRFRSLLVRRQGRWEVLR